MKLVVRMDSYLGWNIVTWYTHVYYQSIGMMVAVVVPVVDLSTTGLGFDLPQFLLPISSRGWSLDPP